jgi:hypothetical protein
MKHPRFVIAVGALLVASMPVAAQVRCTNPQSVGCEFRPPYGWIVIGSAPTTAPGPSGATPGSPSRPGPADGLVRTPTVEERPALKARAATLLQQFLPVFEQARVNQYDAYLPQVERAANSFGNAAVPVYNEDRPFWGGLYLRMAVANLELAEVNGSVPNADKALLYLVQVRNLGLPDAYEMMSQMAALGLGRLVPSAYQGSYSDGLKTWEQKGANGSRPPLIVQPPISLADRRPLLEPYLATHR